MSDRGTETTRRLRSNWAQTWKLGRHWRIEIEWVYLARYFTVSVWDSRREDG